MQSVKSKLALAFLLIAGPALPALADFTINQGGVTYSCNPEQEIPGTNNR